MKTCQQCQTSFEVTDQDREFFEKMAFTFNGKSYPIDEPNLCPDCRQQRRLSFRNERNLYQRTCDLTQKKIISIYSPDKKNKVYEQKVWWGDDWDALSYGRDYDFTRSFFDQYHDLLMAVPHSAAGYRFHDENCDFTTYQNHSKNCYLTFGSGYMEDCAYTNWTYYAKNSFDTLGSEHIEWCYELVDCNRMYGSMYCQDCANVNDSRYCYDCHSCRDCFGCVGLRQKQYCFLNEQLSETEYKEKIKNVDLPTFLKQFEELKAKIPRRAVFQLNCENSTGDHLVNCKNVTESFYASDSQDCRYQTDVVIAKDCWDCSRSGETELAYQTLGGGFYYHTVCCIAGEQLNESAYCLFCFNSKNIFGCMGLKHQEYCILNKRYSKEEYETLVEKIIEHMKASGEFGEWFPMQHSPFGYNETLAQEYYPMEKTTAESMGLAWNEYQQPPPAVEKIIPGHLLPTDISKIPDDVLNWAIECEATKKPFKIIPQELQFYRQFNIPLPHFHPDERHRRRIALRLPRKLYQRQCSNCSAEIQTCYPSNRPEKILCEKCYLNKVY